MPSPEMQVVPWRESFKHWATVTTLTNMIRVSGISSACVELNVHVLQDALQKHSSYIIGTWHNNAYFANWLLKGRSVRPMISRSRDGEIITQVMENFGFKAFRGSSSEGGSQALREMIREAKKPEPFAITVDGPLGPIYNVKLGIITLAKMTGLPIIPWDYQAVNQFVAEKSWDRHKLPKPLTVIFSAYGDPFYVPRKLSQEGMEAYRIQLEEAMMANRQRALDEVEKLKQQGVDRWSGKIRFFLKRTFQ